MGPVRLQRHVACIIMQTSCSDEAIKYLRYDTLVLRREKHMLKLVKRCLQGRGPQFFNRYFTFDRDIVSRTTRRNRHLFNKILIDSILPCVCTLITHRWRQNVVRTKKYATSRRRVAWLMFSPRFDVLCVLSEYRPTAKWNLFVLYNNIDFWPHFVRKHHVNWIE